MAGAKIQPIRCDSDVVAAHQRANEQHEPIFAPVSVYADDRGWSIMNQLSGVLSPSGQINYSAVYPGVIKAWHLHERQTDFWLCVAGHIKAGIFREADGAAWQTVMGEQAHGVLIVPSGLWHGVATVGPTTAGLLYYVTTAYDPANPDEQRRPHDSVTGFSWAAEHR